MFDTRLLPFGRSPLIPLYKPQGLSTALCSEGIRIDLLSMIAANANCCIDDVFLASSGSSALVLLLKHLKHEGMSTKIGIPSYCCPEVQDAVTASGLVTIYYDLSPNAALLENEFDLLACMGVDLVLWPTFFCFSQRLSNIFSKAASLGIKIILDEAQSFPFDGQYGQFGSNHIASIISFGRSKKLRSVGGGGLIAYDCALPGKLPTFCYETKTAGTPITQDDHPQTTVVYGRLDELAMNRVPVQVRYTPMSCRQVASVYRAFREYELNSNSMAEKYAILRRAISRACGKRACWPIDQSDHNPSVAAFAINNSDRFSLMQSLKKKGIQSTWYYFPLHLVRDNPSTGDMSGTINLASTITVLPCGPRHSVGEIKYIARAIECAS